MIRLGLRMAVAGGRAAIARLAIIGVAVAIGVGLVLSALAGMTAAQRQNAHYGWPGALAVLFGVPIGAAFAARLALRRVRVSPLGVLRRTTPKPPRAWRLLPLLAGLAELTWFVGRRPATTNGQTAAYFGGILVVMTEVVVAGPWLTMTGSRLLARRARRPAAMIAGRRLADDPRAGFRSISGLALAGLVVSLALIASTMPLLRRLTGPETVRND